MIRKEEEKHFWAIRILDELLEHSTMYDNTENAGANPYIGSENDNRETIPFLNESGNNPLLTCFFFIFF